MLQKIVLAAVLVGGMFISTYAQKNIPPALAQRLEGKTKVVDIMQEVNAFYDYGRAIPNAADAEEAFEGNEYKRWKKWEYWAMRRLNPDGTLANFKKANYLAIQQTEQRFAQQLDAARQQVARDEANNWRPNELGTPAENTSALRSYGSWSSIGPTTGGAVVSSGTNIDINGLARMDRIGFHPTDPNIFYVCSPSGGIHKTTNGGNSWTSIGNGLPSGVACIAVGRSNGNVIYAFTGDGDSHASNFLVFDYMLSPNFGGLYKSTDAGATWTRMATPGSENNIGRNMTVSYGNSNFLFVATQEGLYRSTDGAASWTQVRIGAWWDVEFSPNNDSTVYASSATQIAYSTNGGRSDTWQTSTLTPAIAGSPSRIDLGVRDNRNGSISSTVYALVSQAGNGTFGGIYRSSDNGETFDRQTNTPNILGTQTNGSGTASLGRYGNSITVDPDNLNRIATGSLCMWRSDGANGGTSMVYSSTFREGFGPASAYAHPDIHDVRYNPLNGILYSCNDGGVYKSEDNGVTWVDISEGLLATQVYRMAMKDANGDGEMDGLEMVLGCQDNGVKYRTSTGAWRHILCCDGYGGAIKGTDGDYVMMSMNDILYTTANGGVNMTPRGNATFFTPLAIDYDFDDTVYMAFTSGVRQSVDGMASFTLVSNTDVNNFITTCPSNSSRLYGSGSSRMTLRTSDDRGANWTTINNTTNWPAGNPIITDAKASPSNSQTVYVSFGGFDDGIKVYRSLNAGDSWSDFSGSLPNVPVHALCVAPEGVYAGTEIGVFFRSTSASDWTPFYTGMPRAIITDIWVNSNGLIYASTFGRGCWISARYQTCDANINVAGNLDGPRYYEASNSVTVTATSQSGDNTEIYAKANNYVDLKEGFEIKDGTFFRGYLGPCSVGGIPTATRIQQGLPIADALIEYDTKDTQRRKKRNAPYFTAVENGIEFVIDQPGIHTISARLLKPNGESILVLQDVPALAGMYRIPVGISGRFEGEVTVNGVALPKF
jgi:photosystem II stability/assembly factor-like uncharacterized protein